MIEQLRKQFKEKEQLYLSNCGKKESLLEAIKSNQDNLKTLEDKIELYNSSNEILQTVSVLLQEKAKYYFNDLISKALKFIFDKDYQFEIDFKISRNVLVCEFNIKSDITSGDPKLMSGGGVVDVISEALRIAVLELYNPRIEGPIILDERLKMLSSDYVANAAQFLSKVSEEFNRQIIFITHQEEFSEYANKTFRL
jgi:DNA repair exonuclease SbcCD ATPase subunit